MSTYYDPRVWSNGVARVETDPYEDWKIEDLLPEVMGDDPFEPKPVRKRATRESKTRDYRRTNARSKKAGRNTLCERMCGDHHCPICQQTIKHRGKDAETVRGSRAWEKLYADAE